MKYAAIILLAILSFKTNAQYKIHFEDISLQQAIDESRQRNKPVMFMGFADWCGHCQKMKETVFTDDSIGEFFNAHFICLMMDMEKGDGIALHDKFFVNSYPTFVFLDSTGQTIFQIAGELSASGFMQEGRNALNPDLQLTTLKMNFERNVLDTDRCLKYLQGLNHGRLPTMKVMRTYFTAQGGKPPITAMNWRILNAGVSDITSPEFKYILDQQKEYGAIVSQAKVERKIFRTAAFNLQPLANNNDTANYFRQRNTLKDVHVRSLDSLVFNLDLMIYETANRWSEYEMEALQHTQEFEWTDYSSLQHIASQFLLHITENASLAVSAEWAMRSVELRAEYGNTLLYAKLLEKTGDRSEAVEVAFKAKQIASVTHASTQEADDLLKRLGN